MEFPSDSRNCALHSVAVATTAEGNFLCPGDGRRGTPAALSGSIRHPWYPCVPAWGRFEQTVLHGIGIFCSRCLFSLLPELPSCFLPTLVLSGAPSRTQSPVP